MTPDQLRALANALDDCDPPYYESSPQINRSLDACIAKAADYLRAQADAQPVAVVPAKWTERHTSAQTWIEDADQAHDLRLYVSGIMESHDQRIAYAQEIARRLNAALAAPQAEQPIDLDAVAMQQMRQAAAESTWMPSEYSGSDWISDVCRWLRDGPPAAAPQAEPHRNQPLRDLLAVIHCDGGHHTEAVGIEQSIKDALSAVCVLKGKLAQAEPKREPSCLWSRADDDTDVWETKCGHAFTIIDGTPTDNQMAFCCYCGRRVDEEIGGSDE